MRVSEPETTIRRDGSRLYGYALKRLTTRAYLIVTISICESINGLCISKITRHVQFAHPASLDRAISLALEFEAFEGVQNNTL